jgi:hypothetical protein
VRTDLRCAACVIFGGTQLEDEREAEELAQEPGQEGESFEGGELVELQPCLPPHYLAEIARREGRPCPRPGIGMDAETATAFELVQLSISESTRHLVEGMLRDEAAGPVRSRLRRRVAMAIQDPAIAALARRT